MTYVATMKDGCFEADTLDALKLHIVEHALDNGLSCPEVLKLEHWEFGQTIPHDAFNVEIEDLYEDVRAERGDFYTGTEGTYWALNHGGM